MKLYLAYRFHRDSFDGQSILGIFSTEENAKIVLAKAEELDVANGGHFSGYTFEEYNLDEVIY